MLKLDANLKNEYQIRIQLKIGVYKRYVVIQVLFFVIGQYYIKLIQIGNIYLKHVIIWIYNFLDRNAYRGVLLDYDSQFLFQFSVFFFFTPNPSSKFSRPDTLTRLKHSIFLQNQLQSRRCIYFNVFVYCMHVSTLQTILWLENMTVWDFLRLQIGKYEKRATDI